MNDGTAARPGCRDRDETSREHSCIANPAMRSIPRLGAVLTALCLLWTARPAAGQVPRIDSLVVLSSPANRAAIALLPPTARQPLVSDTPVVRRPRAIEYSDTYYTRLTIHRYASYTMIPLFVAEYSLGQNLMNDGSPPTWMKPAHGLAAGGVGVLFGLNTITGVWNLWDSRQDPAGRTRRIVHSVMMLASDAGFFATGVTAPGHHRFYTNYNDYLHRERVHRDLAVGSIALSTIGGAMMWFWKQ